MTSLQAFNGYSNPAHTLLSDIPYSQGPSSIIKPIISNNQIKSVIALNGSQGAGGRLDFQIPSEPDSMLRSCSAYVRGTLNIVGSGFTGAAAPVYFNNLSQDSSALVRQVYLQQAGQNIETINFYGEQVIPAVLEHMTNLNAQKNYASIAYQGVGMSLTSGDTSVSLPFAIPLLSGTLCSEKDYPLFLNNNPLMVSMDIQNDLKKVFYTASGSVSSFTLSSCELVYETIQFEKDYIDNIRTQMMQGNVYQMPCSTWQAFQQAGSSAIYQLFSAAYSSLNGVFFTFCTPQSSQASLPVWKSNSLTLAEVYVDNKLKNSCLLDVANKVNSLYAETRRAIQGGSLYDTETCALDSTITVGTAAALAGTYLNNNFLCGINTMRCNDLGMSMRGTPCSQVSLKINSSATNSDVLFCMLHYDYVLTWDANGNLSKLQ